MSALDRRLATMAVAAVLVGAVVALLAPQHAATLVALAAGTTVVVGAALALLLVAPLAAAARPASALDHPPGPGAEALEPAGLRDARRDLGRSGGTGPVPEPVRQRLAVAAQLHLVRVGLDLDGRTRAGTPRATARGMLRATTYDLLTGAGTPGPRAATAPTAATAAAAVHRTLDELEALTAEETRR